VQLNELPAFHVVPGPERLRPVGCPPLGALPVVVIESAAGTMFGWGCPLFPPG